MPIYLRPKKSFIDRVVKPKERCFLDQLGDDDITICGKPVKAILEKEYDASDEFQKKPRVVKLHWFIEDMPNVRAGDPVRQSGDTYLIKNGFPVIDKGCWFYAELKTVKRKRS